MLCINQVVNIPEGLGQFPQALKVLVGSENFQGLFFLMIINFVPLLKFTAI